MFGIEGGDGFDEARDGKGVADAAGATDEVQPAALAGEGNGEFDEGRDAGAIDLWNIVEVDDQLPRTLLQEILGEVIEVLAGLADGEPAVDLKIMDTVGFAGRDFQRWMKRHEFPLSSTRWQLAPGLRGIRGPCIIR